MGFIFFGLTVVASLMNLLVIRIVAFYSQERLLEKLREEEAASQAVLLKGDVICSTNPPSKPRSISPALVSGRTLNQQAASETSVCSCTCMETFSHWKRTRRKRHRPWEEKNLAPIPTLNSDEFIQAILMTRRNSI